MKKDRVLVVLAAGVAAFAVSLLMTNTGKSDSTDASPVSASVSASPTLIKSGRAVDLVNSATRKTRSSRSKPAWSCDNPLAMTIYRAGFRGENIREAWAISMRESHGVEDQITNGVDVGLFQFNYPSWGNQSWWDWDLLLDGDYNARIAFKVSKGGSDWAHWGLDGNGNPDPKIYRGVGWTEWQIQHWIVLPYRKYYDQYPC